MRKSHYSKQEKPKEKGIYDTVNSAGRPQQTFFDGSRWVIKECQYSVVEWYEDKIKKEMKELTKEEKGIINTIDLQIIELRNSVDVKLRKVECLRMNIDALEGLKDSIQSGRIETEA